MSNILVVDDDPDILFVIQATLEAAGHSVLSFTDPEEAVAEAPVRQPDAAVLDVRMPKQSGYDVLSALRGHSGTRSLPILLLSALDSAQERVKGLRHGADDYLGKPFHPEELVARLERLLERDALVRETQASPAISTGQMVAEAASEVGSEDSSAKPPTQDLEISLDFDGSPSETGEYLGRYKVLDVLGQGSMGTVFRGWDPKLQRTVALKTLRPMTEEMSQSDLLSRLLHEAVMVARFSHPNIVAVFDVADGPDAAFIAMEYVPGPSLDLYLQHVGRLHPGDAATITASIAHALAASHACDVVHHDVKPGNVLLDRHGAVKVTDFGLASGISGLVQDSGRVFGTPGFLAPEVLRGQPYNKAADLFGLGATLYLCLTGVPAFTGENVNQVIAATVKGAVVPPSVYNSQVTPELEEIVSGLLQGNEQRRLSEAGEVAMELERLAGQHTEASWPSPLLSSKKMNRRGKERQHMRSMLVRTGFDLFSEFR